MEKLLPVFRRELENNDWLLGEYLHLTEKYPMCDSESNSIFIKRRIIDFKNEIKCDKLEFILKNEYKFIWFYSRDNSGTRIEIYKNSTLLEFHDFVELFVELIFSKKSSDRKSHITDVINSWIKKYYTKEVLKIM
jgi:hypothetical protein